MSLTERKLESVIQSPPGSQDIQALSLSPRGRDSKPDSPPNKLKVQKLVETHQLFIENSSPVTSPRDQSDTKPLLSRSKRLYIKAESSKKAESPRKEGPSIIPRNQSLPTNFSRKPRKKRSQSEKRSVAASSNSQGTSKRRSGSESQLRLRIKPKMSKKGTDSHVLFLERDEGASEIENAIGNPYAEKIKDIYCSIFEKQDLENEKSPFKKNSPNSLLILNERGKLEWVLTDHFNPKSHKVPPSSNTAEFAELVRQTSAAFQMILTVIKECQRMGFRTVVERTYVSYQNRGSNISEAKTAKTHLTDLFKHLIKSHAGHVVLLNDHTFRKRLEGFYWKHLYRDLYNTIAAMRELLRNCEPSITRIMDFLEVTQNKQIRKFKRRTVRSKSKEDLDDNDRNILLNQLGVMYQVSGSSDKEKHAYFMSLMEKPKVISGHTGRSTQSYKVFFQGADVAFDRLCLEKQRVRSGLKEYISNSYHLKERRHNLENSLMEGDFQTVLCLAFRHPQQEVQFYLEAFPKMLKHLALRACTYIKSKERKADLEGKIKRYLSSPVQWHHLQSIINQIAEALSSGKKIKKKQ